MVGKKRIHDTWPTTSERRRTATQMIGKILMIASKEDADHNRKQIKLHHKEF
jgi:hypothetical protein